MNTKTDAAPAEPPRKPRLSLFFATAGGAGYLPKAPGTWGSLVGVLLFMITRAVFMSMGWGAIEDRPHIEHGAITFYWCPLCNQVAISIVIAISIAIALAGVLV